LNVWLELDLARVRGRDRERGANSIKKLELTILEFWRIGWISRSKIIMSY